MLVEDVLTPTSCVCRTEEGRIVDGESLVHLNLACFYFFHIAFNDVKDPCAVIIKWPVCVPVRCEAGHAWNSRPKKWQWNHHGCPGWAERTGKQKIICIDVHPLFFKHLCSFLLFQVGRILQRDKNKCRAMVQLDRYEEKVFTLDYDTICHYVGGA